MGIKEDLPLLAGILLILGGIVFATGSIGLDGIGDIGSGIDEIGSDTDPDQTSTYDVTTQINIGSTTFGEVFVEDFTYQTQESGFSLSIAESGPLAILGANNVKADVTVENTDTGKVYVSTTKFFGDIAEGETKRLDIDFDNAKPGNYEIEYDVTFDPSVYDLTNPDNRIVKTKSFEVPKQVGGS